MSGSQPSVQTIDHMPGGSNLPGGRSVASSPRPKVGFARGSRVHFSAEMGLLLRTRLQAAALLLAILLAAAFASTLFSDYAPLPVLRAAIWLVFAGSYCALPTARGRFP